MANLINSNILKKKLFTNILLEFCTDIVKIVFQVHLL